MTELPAKSLLQCLDQAERVRGDDGTRVHLHGADVVGALHRVTAVHDSGYIGTGVLVCILDDGFNFHDKHEALRNVVIAPGMQRDFTEGDTVLVDGGREGGELSITRLVPVEQVS